MNAIWKWIRAKFGRIVATLGFLLQGADLDMDINPIRDPLESFLGHKAVQGIIVGLFLLSWLRHQWVASQHPKAASLPAPVPEATR